MPRKPGVPARNTPLKLKLDTAGFFKALGKGLIDAAAQRYELVAKDFIDLLGALGLKADEEKLAFELVFNSLRVAMTDLLREGSDVRGLSETDREALSSHVEGALQVEIILTPEFFANPEKLDILPRVQEIYSQWLQGLLDIDQANAKTMSDRLPAYFCFALYKEWERGKDHYEPLNKIFKNPFYDATRKQWKRDWGWQQYASALNKQVQESLFLESFSLEQIYVSPRAYYEIEDKSQGRDDLSMFNPKKLKTKRHVVDLETELRQWIQKKDPRDIIRVLSGGPGSGKSSFGKILAAKLAKENHRVIFIELHLVDPQKDLIEIGREFVAHRSDLSENPLDPNTPEPHLLIILDGLDELSMQGKAGKEVSDHLIVEVLRRVEMMNREQTRWQVVISGREIAVRNHALQFSRYGQILQLLPYWIPPSEIKSDEFEYVDPHQFLEIDQRNEWWQKYGSLIGKNFDGLPSRLAHDSLIEVTSQPFLGFLVAWNYCRGESLSSDEFSLNQLYQELVDKVYHRPYAKNKVHPPIQDISFDSFCSLLEEIAISMWHENSRTTTLASLQKNVILSGSMKSLVRLGKRLHRGLLAC